MAAGGDGALPAPVFAAAEPANDADSLHVNPGSPRSPPPLDGEHDGRSPQPPLPPSRSSGTDETDLKAGASHHEASDERAATRFILDPAGDLTFDETTVDVVTVPCPGGHPLRSWSRDGLMSRYFGAPSMRDAEVKDEMERPSPSWVRQGVRREADRARILLYEHPEAVEGTTLGRLADALLEELQALRVAEGQERPLVFIGHSIGGLVVKMALTKASRGGGRYDNIMRECYGVAFFGTPHQGSSYFAMPSLAPSIQSLLQLAAPLPASVTDDLRVGNGLLQHVDEDFKSVSSDVRVWTFYETIDSRLSGGGGPGPESRDVYFTAPLTSVKSAILGMRLEMIFPMQSDHANMASFGRNNVHTLRMFLRQLAAQIKRADMSLRDADADGHWTLGLGQKVNVEVHGFFDDPLVGGHPEEGSVVRAWSTRLPLKEFLAKGPEACLSERLNEVEGAPEETRFLRARGRTSLIERDTHGERGGSVFTAPAPLTIKNALGIQDRQAAAQLTVTPGSPIIRPVDYPHDRTRSAPVTAPRGPTTPPSRAISPPTRQSSPPIRASPLIRADFEQDLAIDRLSPPLRPRVGRSISRSFSLGSDRSRVEFRDFPPFSQRSRSTFDDAARGGDADADADDIDASPRLPEAVVAMRKAARDGRQQRSSETAVADEVPVAFVKPDVRARRFVWVHVPFNNPTWVKSVLQTLEVCYKRDLSMLYSHDFWATRHTRGRHAQHYAYFAKPGCYFTAPRTMSPRHSLTSPAMSPASVDEAMYTCLFLPYLHFDSYKRLIRRRDLILRRLSYGRARPVPEFVAKSDSLELQVVWEFLGHDPPINCRRTLDQYGYPSLRDTRSRDDDQMLYKLTKERGCYVSEQDRDMSSQGSSTGTGSQREGRVSSSASMGWRERLMGRNGGDDSDDTPEEEMVLNGNVLMVDQLWLWVINSHTVLSFFPKRESDPIEGPLYQQADLRDSIFNEVNVDLTRQCENALDLAALAALHAVSVLLDRSSHPDLEVFRIFEEAISVLTEKLTSSLKEFRTVGFRDKAFDYEPVENKARSIRARHKEEGLRAEQENRDNTSALLELRDIEDELLTLLHLFERQSKVIASMAAIYARPELRDHTAGGRAFLGEALKRLREYAHQADEMTQRVRATRDDYDKLLQMVQRQAQVDEVRLSRLHADLASAQSRSVMIFTTFTVIFLPLTFFTGLFGMNTREWGGGDNLELRTIGAVALPSSLVLVVASLVIAFSTGARRFLRWLGRGYGRATRWACRTLWRPLLARALRAYRRRGRRRAGDEREAARRRRMLDREVSDFWERHRLERERGYRIPEVNRKKAAAVASGGSGGGGSGSASGTFGVRMRGVGTRTKRDK